MLHNKKRKQVLDYKITLNILRERLFLSEYGYYEPNFGTIVCTDFRKEFVKLNRKKHYNTDKILVMIATIRVKQYAVISKQFVESTSI